MTHLLDRLRAATEPSRELWREAFKACHPQPQDGWERLAWRFADAVNASAWLDAALMLMPPIGDLTSGPGCAWALYAGWLGTSLKNVAPGYSVHVELANDGHVTREIRTGRTSHPAIALAIAALEAREHD